MLTLAASRHGLTANAGRRLNLSIERGFGAEYVNHRGVGRRGRRCWAQRRRRCLGCYGVRLATGGYSKQRQNYSDLSLVECGHFVVRVSTVETVTSNSENIFTALLARYSTESPESRLAFHYCPAWLAAASPFRWRASPRSAKFCRAWKRKQCAHCPTPGGPVRPSLG